MPENEVSLKATVAELDKVTKELGRIQEHATGERKKELELKIQSLNKVRSELVDICHKTYPVYIPTKP